MNTVNYINEKLNSAKELDFGTIFNEAIELFKKTWVHGMLAQLFIIIIMLPFIIMIYTPLIALAITQEQSGGYASNTMDDIFAGFSFLYIVFIFFILILLSTIAGAIGAGLYRVIKKIDHDEVVVTRDLFYYLRVNYAGKLLGIMAISILIAIPSALLCYIPLIYMMVPLSLFSPVFAFNSHFSVREIVSVSFKLGAKKWLLLFGLIFVSSLLAQLIGMLACGIGVLVTAPFIYHPVYLVYKKVVGFGYKEEALDFGKIEY